MAKHKVMTFAPIIALATLIAVSLLPNGIIMMWKIQQEKRDDAEFIRFHHGNRAKGLIRNIFQPASAAYRVPS